MTGSPPSDSLQKISVIDVYSAATSEGMFTLVLGEQLRCSCCGNISTRWQVPAGGVPYQRRPSDIPEGLGGHDPGE